MQDAIRRLPEDYRVAVVLCDVVGLTYDEIAVAIDVAHRDRPVPHPSRAIATAGGAGGMSDHHDHRPGGLDPVADDDPSELLSAYLDGELNPTEVDAVQAYLERSAAARLELEALTSVRSTLRSLPAVDPPFGFYERMLLPPRAAQPARRQRRAWPKIAITAGAAAAAFVVIVGVTPVTDRVRSPGERLRGSARRGRR